MNLTGLEEERTRLMKALGEANTELIRVSREGGEREQRMAHGVSVAIATALSRVNAEIAAWKKSHEQR